MSYFEYISFYQASSFFKYEEKVESNLISHESLRYQENDHAEKAPKLFITAICRKNAFTRGQKVEKQMLWA